MHMPKLLDIWVGIYVSLDLTTVFLMGMYAV